MVTTTGTKPWILDPNSICSTFPENPVNSYLNSNNNWSISLTCELNTLTGDDMTIFCILPHYLGLDIHKKTPYISITYVKSGNVFYELPFNYVEKRKDKYTIEHSTSKGVSFYLNDSLIFNSPIKEQIKSEPRQISIVGSNTSYTEKEAARNSDLILHSYEVYVDNVLLSDNDFSNTIMNKTIDRTGNLNFLYN